MIRKLAAPGGPSANALAAEVGVAQSTLSRWLREAGTVSPVPRKKRRRTGVPAPRASGPSPKSQRTQDWSPEEKMRVLREADGLDDTELGALLRREGLHEVQVEQWRRDAIEALGGRKQRSADQKKVRQLERELKRKDKALAEAAALLVLQKKFQALWADEDENTTEGSDE